MAIMRKRDKAGKFAKNNEAVKEKTTKKEEITKEANVEEVEAPVVEVKEPVKEIKKEKVQGLSDFLF